MHFGSEQQQAPCPHANVHFRPSGKHTLVPWLHYQGGEQTRLDAAARSVKCRGLLPASSFLFVGLPLPLLLWLWLREVMVLPLLLPLLLFQVLVL